MIRSHSIWGCELMSLIMLMIKMDSGKIEF